MSLWIALLILVLCYLLAKSFNKDLDVLDTKCKFYMRAVLYVYVISPILRRFRSVLLENAPLPGDASISAQFLTNILRKNKVLDSTDSVISASVEDLKGNRGLSGAINRVRLAYSSGNSDKKLPATLIVKCTLNSNTVDGVYKSYEIQQFREATFYNVLGKKLSLAPKAYYTWGSKWVGVYIIVMEDVQQTTGVNLFFGNQVWGIPNPIEHPQDPVKVLHTVFNSAAAIQASYWNDASLMEMSWLKGCNWYKGKDRATWEIFMNFGRSYWEKGKKNIGKDSVQWNPKLVSVIDKSWAQCSWEKMQASLHNKKTPFTLSHGDFHASNMLWKNISDSNSASSPLLLIDWTETGVWEPATDLGQMIISDVKPSLWKTHEKEVLTEYYNTLIKHGVSSKEYPYQQFWEEFSVAPVGRWIWLISILTGWGLPPNALQYFHDQLLSFIESHGDHPSYVLKP